MLVELLNLFIYEASAARLLREVRWAEGVRCPYCSSEAIIRWAWYRHVYQRYRCKVCLRTFNDKTGTIFAYSRIPLKEWLFLAYLLGCLHISILKASRELGRSYGAVYRSARKIMYAIHRCRRRLWSSRKLSGDVEMDEVYIKAGLKGRGNHWRILSLGRKPRCRGLKARRGRESWDKDMPPIIILVERKGVERYVLSMDVESETVGRVALRNVEPGSRIYTDSFISYTILQTLGFKHERVNHSIREYARGNIHTNNCENRASILKPWLAIHRGVSKDNLDVYLSFFHLQRTTSKLPNLQKIKLIIKT